MNRLIPALAAACFALSAPFAFAQTPSGEGKPRMSEQQRKEMREKMKGAWEACKDKSDKRACMMEQRCAKAADPAKCQAEGKQRMSRRMDERQKAHEACTGKRGDELKTCLKSQRQHMKHDRHDKKG